MKTRKELEKVVERKGYMVLYSSGVEIGNDLELYLKYARAKDYCFTIQDAFAIAYMAGQSDLKTLFDEKTLRKAITKYDKTDPTNRFDTVAETFMDLLDYKYEKNNPPKHNKRKS